ncbi:hypothetical protein [Caballeronia sp. ATUFL_M1_KS5A]|uniref:hypothetical protein n=1 Tax=Caballeronia sp. ATUFL_M1_KS5A TaxID=2921778 RepID=UPI002028CCA6
MNIDVRARAECGQCGSIAIGEFERADVIAFHVLSDHFDHELIGRLFRRTQPQFSG